MTPCKLLLVAAALGMMAWPVQAQDEKKPPQRPNQAGGQFDGSRLFDQLDRNKKGFLEKADLPERMRERFDALDADKDGKISKEEFQKGFQRIGQPNPGTPGNPPPPMAGVDALLRLFDSNRDGKLSREELTNAVKLLEKFDKNKDGVLDRDELLAALAAVSGPSPGGDVSGDIQRRVVEAFERLDKNNDGKISKDEAMGPIKENFERLDANGDGFIDRDELRKSLAQFLAQNGTLPGRPNDGPRPPGDAARPVNFDELDKNADGRLTKEEVKGTPWADKFDDIDTNKDGKIDPKEFEAYLKKQEKKSDK